MTGHFHNCYRIIYSLFTPYRIMKHIGCSHDFLSTPTRKIVSRAKVADTIGNKLRQIRLYSKDKEANNGGTGFIR